MATSSITFRADENLKQNFEKLASQMGVPMTSLLNAFMKASVRAGKLPFELVSDEYAYNQWIIEKLKESEKEAADPKTVMLSHEEIFGRLREKYKYEI
jgi:DNA-damage-inducible protein J